MPKPVVPVTWRFDPVLFARVQAVAHARGISVQAFASEALAEAVKSAEPSGDVPGMTAEDRAWLDADLGGDLPPYDWGPGGLPPGRPVRFVPGRGLVVEGGRHAR